MRTLAFSAVGAVVIGAIGLSAFTGPEVASGFDGVTEPQRTAAVTVIEAAQVSYVPVALRTSPAEYAAPGVDPAPADPVPETAPVPAEAVPSSVPVAATPTSLPTPAPEQSTTQPSQPTPPAAPKIPPPTPEDSPSSDPLGGLTGALDGTVSGAAGLLPDLDG